MHFSLGCLPLTRLGLVPHNLLSSHYATAWRVSLSAWVVVVLDYVMVAFYLVLSACRALCGVSPAPSPCHPRVPPPSSHPYTLSAQPSPPHGPALQSLIPPMWQLAQCDHRHPLALLAHAHTHLCPFGPAVNFTPCEFSHTPGAAAGPVDAGAGAGREG